MRKFILGFISLIALVFTSYQVSFALFSSNATSQNNTFTAASIFPTVSPTPISCVPGTSYAVAHSNVTQGPKKDESPITDPNRIDPNEMLGAPDWITGTGTNFFAMGKEGTLTLEFANPISSAAVDDLKIYEATNGRTSYPLEEATVEVSLDGLTFTPIGTMSSEPTGDGINNFDLTSDIKFVRLTEITNTSPHDNTWDGVDVDAISGNIVCNI